MKLNRFFCVLLFFGLIVGCKSTAPIAPKKEVTETTIEKIVTVKDTVLITAADSAFYEAYIDCINNKPVITNSKQKQGRKTTVDVNLTGNQLKIDCKTEAERLFYQWRETYIKEQQKKNTENPVIVRELTRWQHVRIFFGSIFLGLLVLVIIYFLVKIFNNYKKWKTKI